MEWFIYFTLVWLLFGVGGVMCYGAWQEIKWKRKMRKKHVEMLKLNPQAIKDTRSKLREIIRNRANGVV